MHEKGQSWSGIFVSYADKMDSAQHNLDALVFVFFAIALGYIGGTTRDLDVRHVGELNALVMDLAVPAPVFCDRRPDI